MSLQIHGTPVLLVTFGFPHFVQTGGYDSMDVSGLKAKSIGRLNEQRLAVAEC